jgi:hypothetical protein
MGVGARCKECLAERRKPGILESRRKTQELHATGIKTCGRCKQAKPVSAYHVRRASRDGLAYSCIECVNANTRRWREKNPNAFRQWAARNQEHRAERNREWRLQNKDWNAARLAAWARKNNHIINAAIARRLAMKMHALPSWADLGAIENIYAEAVRRTRETGIRHEVDHIYPLRSDIVCGLHCEANLQILTKTENIRKSSRMPDFAEAIWDNS